MPRLSFLAKIGCLAAAVASGVGAHPHAKPDAAPGAAAGHRGGGLLARGPVDLARHQPHARGEGVLREYNFTITQEWLAPDGYWRQAFAINGQTPGPPITATEGDTVRVNVVNNCNTQSTVHFHGIVHTDPQQDGVPGLTQWSILPYGNWSYEWKAIQSGAYWYHSHSRGTYVDGLRGPIIIQPAADVARPWSAIDNSSYDSLEEAYKQAVPLMLHDWRHETFDNALIRYRGTGQDPYCTNSMLINSQGRVHCLDASTLKGYAGTAAQFGLADYLDPTGCVPPVSSFEGQLQNDNARTCTNTSSAYGVYPTSTFGSSDGNWAAFHLINAGAEWQSCFSIDGHDLWVVARDADFVKPQKVQVVELVLGSRYTVIVPTKGSQGQYRIRLAACGNLPQILAGYAVLDVDKASKPPSYTIPSRRQLATPEPAGVSTATLYSPSQASAMDMPPDAVIGFPVPTDQPYIPTPSQAAALPLQQAKWSNGFPQADTPAGKKLGWTVTNKLPSQGTEYLHYNGSIVNGGVQQNESTLAPFTADPPPQGPADHTFHLALNMTNVITWSLVGANKTFSTLNFQGSPLLFERASPSKYGSAVPSDTLLEVKNGSVVDIIFVGASTPLGPNPPHPIHKHNDQVWYLGSGSGALNYTDVSDILAHEPSLINMKDPERVDSWNVPALGWAIVRYRVLRPSISFMHCHIAQHLSAAMAVALVEGPELLNQTHISALNRDAPHVPPPYVPANGIVGLSEL